MAIKNIYGKGGSTHGKTSSQLNLPSQSIDRRRKENASYRTKRCKTVGHLDDNGNIVFKDGTIETTNYNLKRGE